MKPSNIAVSLHTFDAMIHYSEYSSDLGFHNLINSYVCCPPLLHTKPITTIWPIGKKSKNHLFRKSVPSDKYERRDKIEVENDSANRLEIVRLETQEALPSSIAQPIHSRLFIAIDSHFLTLCRIQDEGTQTFQYIFIIRWPSSSLH